MKLIRFIGYYSIILGCAIMAMWMMILHNGDIPEGKTEMGFHLFSEFLMAIICLIGGFILLRRGSAVFNIIAHAMVIYSVINAAGYYAERGQGMMGILFIILFIVSLVILFIHLINSIQAEKK